MLDIFNGVPYGFILEPILFNIVINDLFVFVKICSLYNYANDNSLQDVMSALEEDIN